MSKVVSSGKIGDARFLILPIDVNYRMMHGIEYSATLITPTETYETKCTGWNAARKWVDKMIKKIEDKENESDRYY